MNPDNTDVGQRVAYNHARATSPLVADVVSSRSDWGPKTYNIKTEKLKTAGSVIIYKNNDRPDPKITGPASLVIINPTVQVINNSTAADDPLSHFTVKYPKLQPYPRPLPLASAGLLADSHSQCLAGKPCQLLQTALGNVADQIGLRSC